MSADQRPFGYLYENRGGAVIFHREGACDQKMLNADMEAAALHPTNHSLTPLFLNPSLTPEEEALLVKTGQVWNEFCTLPDSAPSDVDDFYRALHELQRIIAVRAVRRAAPTFFTQHTGT